MNSASGQLSGGNLSSQANLDSWLTRYDTDANVPVRSFSLAEKDISVTTAGDRFTGGRSLIYMAQRQGGFDQLAQQVFIERAKLLRNCDHAHIQAIADFFVDAQALRFVVPYIAGTALEELLKASSMPVALSLELALQFVGIVNYFSVQAPSAVPLLPRHGLIVQSDKTLCTTEFQVHYLFGEPQTELHAAIADFIDLLAAVLPDADAAKRFKQLSTELRTKPVPHQLSTMTKVRNALKHLEETLSKPQTQAEA